MLKLLAVPCLLFLAACAGPDRNFGCGGMYYGERRGVINANGDAIVPLQGPPGVRAAGKGTYESMTAVVVNPALNIFTITTNVKATCGMDEQP